MSSEPILPPKYYSSINALINKYKSSYSNCVAPEPVTNNHNTIGEYAKARQKYREIERNYEQCKSIVDEYNRELEHIQQQLKKPDISINGLNYPIKSQDCSILNKIHQNIGQEMANNFGIKLQVYNTPPNSGNFCRARFEY